MYNLVNRTALSTGRRDESVGVSQKPRSEKRQRTKLLGVRLLPEEHSGFKEFADERDADMAELAFEALREKYPQIFSRTVQVA